ncbi:MAG: TIR domain-containing protein [Geitlerinemataceae cyanobacterium]
MTDVFLSYCRRNKTFVQKLNQAFQEAKREIWVDWEGIPLNADWRQEIYRGIEAADNFVFVLSPDSVASQVCTEEIEHAIANNKRLVPIVCEEVSYDRVHPEMAKLNWIFFRKEDDFDVAFHKLLETLDTDLNYVRDHTRLLKRAIEWDEKNRDASFTLRGSDLKYAEQWLGASEDKQPEPTPLHAQYILASDRQQRQRQKMAFGGVVLGLVATSILAIVAVKQRGAAIVERNNARQQSVRALTALSEARLVTDDGLEALHYAVQASQNLQQSRDLPADLKKATTSTLREAVYNVQEYNRLDGHEDQINRIAFSPNGELIASASDDNTVRIWKRNGEVLQMLQHDDNVRQMAFAPDGKTVASASKDKTVKIWRVEDGTLLNTFDLNSSVRAVRFSPDGELLVTGDDDGQMQLWKSDGQLLKTFAAHRSGLNDIVFSPDGQTFASTSNDLQMKLWDLSEILDENGNNDNPQPQQEFTGHSDKIWDVNFSPDGKELATASSDNTVIIWNLDGTIRSQLKGHSTWVRSVSFSPDGKVLVTGSDDNTVKLWSLGGTLLKTFTGHDASVRSVTFAPDGKSLASASDDATIRLRSLEGVVVETLQGHRASVQGVRFSPNNLIASVSTDNTLKIWSRDGAQLLRSAEYGTEMRNVNFSPDGQLMMTAGYDNTVQLWDVQEVLKTEKAEPIRRFVGHTSTVKNLSISPDGQQMASAGADGTMRLWRISDGKLLKTFEDVHQSEVTDVSFSPDGSQIVSVGGDGKVKVWSTEGELVQELQAHEEWINAVHFSPDNRFLATASGDKTVRLWKWNAGQLETTPEVVLQGHTDWVWDVTFSRDSRLIGTGGKDNTVRLWDTEGRLLKTLSAHKNWVRAVSFSPDGEKLASASADKTIILWDVDSLENMEKSSQDMGVDRLLMLGCDRLGDYLATNPTLAESEKAVCEGVESSRDRGGSSV